MWIGKPILVIQTFLQLHLYLSVKFEFLSQFCFVGVWGFEMPLDVVVICAFDSVLYASKLKTEKYVDILFGCFSKSAEPSLTLISTFKLLSWKLAHFSYSWTLTPILVFYVLFFVRSPYSEMDEQARPVRVVSQYCNSLGCDVSICQTWSLHFKWCVIFLFIITSHWVWATVK